VEGQVKASGLCASDGDVGVPVQTEAMVERRDDHLEPELGRERRQ
jgi:hypothetical protein